LKEENERMKLQMRTLRDVDGNSPVKREVTKRVNPDGTISNAINYNDPSAVKALEVDLQRLKRLCKQQAEQLNTQDEVIRMLRAKKPSFFDENK
jgi:hypothetical protein